jgi:porin
MDKQQIVKRFQELFIVVCIAVLVSSAGIVKAETQASDQNSVSSAGTESAAPNPYAGDIWHRSKLTGDWGGQRTKLAEQGITFDMASTQTYQGVAGGRRQLWKYGGAFQYTIKLDFQKMGLWPGAFLEISAENQFGQFINRNTGALIPANTIGVFPEPGQQEVYLDRVVFMQFFSETFGLFFGKLTTITETSGDWNPFAGGKGNTQFMNLNFVANPVTLTSVPYSTLGGGAIFLFPDLSPNPKQPAMFTISMMGAAGQPGEWPWEDFHSGTATAGELTLPTKFFGKPGGHLLGAAYSSKDSTAIGQDPRLILGDILQGLPPNLQKKAGTSCFYYNFYQYLVSDPNDPTRGWGIFGRYGLADQSTNPIANFYSIGLGGKGAFDGRDKDTWGIGYFYTDISNDFLKIVQRRFGDSQGFEAFYNIEITPWLHITPDFQVIDPSNKQTDIAYVTGLRIKIDF